MFTCDRQPLADPSTRERPTLWNVRKPLMNLLALVIRPSRKGYERETVKGTTTARRVT